MHIHDKQFFIIIYLFFLHLNLAKPRKHFKGFPDNSIMEPLTFQKAAINSNLMELFI